MTPVAMRCLIPILSLPLVGLLAAQNAPLNAPAPAQARALLDRTLRNELLAAQNGGPPMRYILRKTTPRQRSSREIYETRDGDVARLLTVNGRPLSPQAEQQEMARLEELATDPGRQRHRAQAEAADRGRALKVLEALPTAFLYQYAGTGQGTAGPVERFTFRPNPAFSPPDLETQVLTAMSGEIWIDPAQQRVVRLKATLQQDVTFGWGILGRLNKGGWIVIEQAEVAPGVWRTVRLQLAMSGRVFFRTRNFDTTEEQLDYTPVPEMGYREAIEKLEKTATALPKQGR